jgi:DMSO reductase anchor subunit
MTIRNLITIIAFLGLALVIGPAVLYLADVIEKDSMKTAMLAGTALWFCFGPILDRQDTV